MSNRFNWRFLLGEFVVIVLGVLIALWVDELREARVNAGLEVQYLESLMADIDADLARFDGAERGMRASETAAATVLALYGDSPPAENVADLVTAVETAGWPATVIVTRNTIDDLRSTGNLRLIRDPAIRRAISDYYNSVDSGLRVVNRLQEGIMDRYDVKVASVLRPGERMAVLQGSFLGQGLTSEVLEPAEPPGVQELMTALRAFPELEVAAAEVLYQTISNRAVLGILRFSAVELRDELEQWLAARR
jgi:hypothetical protein